MVNHVLVEPSQLKRIQRGATLFEYILEEVKRTLQFLQQSRPSWLKNVHLLMQQLLLLCVAYSVAPTQQNE